VDTIHNDWHYTEPEKNIISELNYCVVFCMQFDDVLVHTSCILKNY